MEDAMNSDGNQFEVLISEEQIRDRIRQMADEISEKYRGQEVLLIGILNGSVFFMTALAQQMSIPLELDFMAASSYVGKDSTGKVLITKDLDRSVKGRHVIIVEDIVDTGQTLYLLREMLQQREPASLEIVTLLDKPERRKVDFQADIIGFRIPDKFVIGWGMDYNQKYRELPYIGVVNE